MNENDLRIQEENYKTSLSRAYITSKELFIDAEERLPQMSFFAAPMIEHRDALDHIMRYFSAKSEGDDLSAVKELDCALSHEIRAFFDIADFICITVRKEINDSLKRISNRKIKKIWTDYNEIRTQMVEISESVADIRKKRSGTIEQLDKYKPVLKQVFDVYQKYSTEIEPKIKSFSWIKK